MDTLELSKYVPSYGDQLAIKDFCRRRSSMNLKNPYWERIRNKSSSKKERQSPTPNIDKTRLIDLGWIHRSHTDSQGVQVRIDKGGGLRTVRVPSDTKKDDLIKMSVQIFQKGLEKKRLSINDVDLELVDFQRDAIDEESTVQDKYAQEKLSRLRYYLMTTERDPSDVIKSLLKSEESCYLKPTRCETATLGLLPKTPQYSSSEYGDKSSDTWRNSATATSWFTPSTSGLARGHANEDITKRPKISPIAERRVATSLLPYDSHDETRRSPDPFEFLDDPWITPQSTFLKSKKACQKAAIAVHDHDYAHREMSPPKDQTSQSYHTCETSSEDIALLSTITSGSDIFLHLHRGNIMNELLEAFQKVSSNCGKIHVTLVSQNGKEEQAVGEGVFRESLSEFWTEFQSRCTEGVSKKVPALMENFRENWPTVAHILRKGWEDVKFFPTFISRPFIDHCIFGETQESLEEAFLEYISPDEANVLKKCLQNWEEADNEELISIFSNYGCRRIPTSKNIRSIIYDVGHKELIQRPKYIIDCWREVLDGIVSLEELNEIYEKRIPNAKNMLRIINIDDIGSMEPEDSVAVGYLKKFIRQSNEGTLANLCRWVTGAFVITCEHIQISFNKTVGLGRTFTAHTCGCVLDVPVTYDSYQEFRHELQSLLNSQYWAMEFV